jgi:ABC-2 type transport system permease protein
VSSARDALRVLPHAIGYEWHKASAFRMGLVLREVLRGVSRSLVMVLVYAAMFESTGAGTIRGYSLRDLVSYLIWTAMIQKLLTDERSLDVAEQIFDGYITKYLVMPVSFFTLMLGKWLCFTALQLVFALLFFGLGALLLPDYWPHAASPAALGQAAVLVLLGAYCFFLCHLILNYLAFWLDVVWSLLNMFRFVSIFVAGILVPVSLMPDAVNTAFSWLFPYWVVFAPAELLLGRMHSADFVRGLCVLAGSAAGLQLLAHLTWRRGSARYAGAGA